MKVLLLTPPMVQFNSPYPATPLLTGFLQGQQVDVCQKDLSLELVLQLFSRKGLQQITTHLNRRSRKQSTDAVRHFKSCAERYINTVDDVISFLQFGHEKTAHRILSGGWLPQGPRFSVLTELTARGMTPFDNEPFARAKYFASLYMDDLADVIREGVDEWFGLSRYAERLGNTMPSFSPLLKALQAKGGLIDTLLDTLVDQALTEFKPDLVGITIPFPGNVYGAFCVASRIRKQAPQTRIVMGGGYVNTEWRRLSDVRVFDFVDYILYDDGEDALLRLINILEGTHPEKEFIRTRLRKNNRVVLMNDTTASPLKHQHRTAPCYDGLSLEKYGPMIENPNPMHRLWTEQRWMKLTLAHGCYWHRCAFCDTSLDYICRYDPASPERIVEWIEQVMEETGQTGFHFVDEAAPPGLLRRLAHCLIERKTNIQWWTNVRFEKAFDAELCSLLAASGCLAVTGGMECAEERLLRLMNKGIALKTMISSAQAFSDAGILVHIYLMYGFPTQTQQEIINALDVIRRLFIAKTIHSAYWHRFALTVHSPIYDDPSDYNITPSSRTASGFSENEIGYTEKNATLYKETGQALAAAVYNYMHGVALDVRVEEWFQ